MNWDGKHKDAKKWNEYAYQAVQEYGPELLKTNSPDLKTFCPNYKNLNKEGKSMFWVHLLSSMTEFESGFKPNTQYKENFKDQNGNYIISRGLLQLSIESSKGYQCGIRRAEELHDAQKNLECGVRIINRWVGRDNRIGGSQSSGKWRGGARYWSVLRKRSSSSSYGKIVSKTRASKVCKL